MEHQIPLYDVALETIVDVVATLLQHDDTPL